MDLDTKAYGNKISTPRFKTGDYSADIEANEEAWLGYFLYEILALFIAGVWDI